jgi:uncharacterized protein (DUF58 family)
MPVRRRAWLTLEGWYYLAVLTFIIGGAVLRSVNLLVVLAGTMIAPPLFNWRLVMASLMGLIVRRRLPLQAAAGVPLSVELEIENTRSWLSSWLVTVEDRIIPIGAERLDSPSQDSGRGSPERDAARGPRGGLWHRRPQELFRKLALSTEYFILSTFRSRRRRTRASALIAYVPARGIARGAYRITIHRRGRYRFGPLRISTRFPLGLVRGQVTFPARAEVVVVPRVGRFLSAWGNLLEADLAGDKRRHPQRGISEGDYYGLRPWQSGDSLRWVHWRTTAKLARPIVRQYERRKSRDVAIILDPWLAEPGELQEGLVELAISMTATAVNDIANRGHSRLTVAIAGREPPCYSGPASTAFCEEVLGRLAELVPGRGYALEKALTQALEAAPRGARMIVISSRSSNDPSLAESSADLSMDPDDLVWIDTASNAVEALFSLD